MTSDERKSSEQQFSEAISAGDVTVGSSDAHDKYSTVMLADGAKLAYDILGSQHLGKMTPVVVVCGMAAMRGDNDRVTKMLAKTYPVLVYDHRGIGDSSLSPNRDEAITIELMARDLLFLLAKLGWEKIIICGHSMGGIIAQQLLVLPYHPIAPASLPFQVTQLLLIASRCKVTEGGGLPIKSVPGKPRSLEEMQQDAKPVVAAVLDPEWIEANTERFNNLLERAVNDNLSDRLADVIAKQAVATRNFDFENLLDRIPRTTQVLIIHGQLDQVVPTNCRDVNSPPFELRRKMFNGDSRHSGYRKAHCLGKIGGRRHFTWSCPDA